MFLLVREGFKKKKKSDFYHFLGGGQWLQKIIYFSLSRNDFQAILDQKNFSCLGGHPPWGTSCPPPLEFHQQLMMVIVYDVRMSWWVGSQHHARAADTVRGCMCSHQFFSLGKG